jgi:succinoglycan biosynthesis transport protein ExoP
VEIEPDNITTLAAPREERSPGKLEVLCSGRALENPDRVATEFAFAGVVRALRDRGDVVLIDSAPLLPVGDTLVLSAKVDAMLLVVRQDALATATLREVEDVLASVPSTKLGLIVTGVDAHEALGQYRYPPARASSDEPVRTGARWSSTKASDESYSYAEATSLEE